MRRELLKFLKLNRPTLEEVAAVTCGPCPFAPFELYELEGIAPELKFISIPSLWAGVPSSQRRLWTAHALIAVNGCEERCPSKLIQTLRRPTEEFTLSPDSTRREVVRELSSLLRQLLQRPRSDLSGQIYTLDCRELRCPLPILKLTQKLSQLAPGEGVEIICGDPSFAADLEAWCERSGAILESLERRNNTVRAVVRRPLPNPLTRPQPRAPKPPPPKKPEVELKLPSREVFKLDCRGLSCPMPIVKLSRAVREEDSRWFEVVADDPAFPADIKAWCNQAGAKLHTLTEEGDHWTAIVELPPADSDSQTPQHSPQPPEEVAKSNPTVILSKRRGGTEQSLDTQKQAESPGYSGPPDIAPPSHEDAGYSELPLLGSIDCRGMTSPMPIVKIASFVKAHPRAGRVEIFSDDSEFVEDLKNWCAQTSSKLLKLREEGGEYRAVVAINLDSPPTESKPKEELPEPFGDTARAPRNSAPPELSKERTSPPAEKGSSDRAESSLRQLDYRGLKCPMPILKLTQTLSASRGEFFKVIADDPAFPADVRAWTSQQPHVQLVKIESKGDQFEAILKTIDLSFEIGESKGDDENIPTRTIVSPSPSIESFVSKGDRSSRLKLQEFRGSGESPPPSEEGGGGGDGALAPRNESEQKEDSGERPEVQIDCRGLKCPQPILQLQRKLSQLKGEKLVEVIADDPAFAADIEAFCKMKGYRLKRKEVRGEVCRAVLEIPSKS